MAKKSQWSKQIKGHKITWSAKQKRYVIKKNGRQVYDTDTQSAAESWIERNVKK